MNKKDHADGPAVRVAKGAARPPSMNPAMAATPEPNRLSASALVRGIKAADTVLLGKAITLLESTRQDDQAVGRAVLEQCPPQNGNAVRVGITGSPGVGKSTFIEALGVLLLDRGHRIAVLTVDPSSVRTRGSILGDKTRMPRLAASPNAFVRPSPSSGALGGVAPYTRSAIRLCEAAGFDIVLVETVGIGQSEIEARSMVDFFLLLVLARGGDELQGIKRGIMEMADAVVVTKADQDNIVAARSAKREYHRALALSAHRESGWRPRVHTCSAITGEGIDTIWDTVEAYVEHARVNGYFETRRKEGARTEIVRKVERILRAQLFAQPGVDAVLVRLQEAVAAGTMTAAAAAQEVLASVQDGPAS